MRAVLFTAAIAVSLVVAASLASAARDLGRASTTPRATATAWIIETDRLIWVEITSTPAPEPTRRPLPTPAPYVWPTATPDRATWAEVDIGCVALTEEWC